MKKILGIDVGGTYIKLGILSYPLANVPVVQNFKSVPTKSDIVKQLYNIIKDVIHCLNLNCYISKIY